MCYPYGPPDELLLLVAKEGNAQRIAASCTKGAALGLLPGLALADARARAPGVRVADADPEADERLLLQLADLADRWSPMVEPDFPDGLLLDISGVAHLFGDEERLAADAKALLGRQLAVRHAIASTPLAAHALVRFPSRGASEAEAVRLLPIAALGLPPDVTTALKRAGLKRISDLADRPTAPLSARFGKQAAQALDRLLGRSDSRLSPRRPLPALHFAQRFAEPVAHVEAVLAAIDGLMQKAALELEKRHAGGRAFALRLYRADGAIRDIRIETGLPTRDPTLLRRLVRERIVALSDPLDPGFGFDLLRLAVPLAEPLLTLQPELEAASRDGETLVALVDRLSVRHGQGRIRRLMPVDSHVPERAEKSLAAQDAPASRWLEPAPAEPPLRPICLFDPPQPIMVMAEVPDAPPRRFIWRGSNHIVVRAEGPERIAAPWWRKASEGRPTRDYYRVEDEAGRRFWLFRRGLQTREAGYPSWYIHGLFA